MGWTFGEYDRTPARDIASALEVWRLDSLHQQRKGKKGR